jgi:hypothetical protein
VTFAADPVFDVALQRCITEAFQGRRAPQRVMDLTRGRPDVPRDYINKSSVFAEALLESVGEPSFAAAFWDVHQGHRFFLRFLADRLRHDGRRLFIRDCGCLGFPTYQIYVSGMTNVHPLVPGHLAFRSNGLWPLVRTLFTLESASPAELAQCADTLHRHFVDGGRPLGRIFSFFYADLPLTRWLDLRVLLALLHLEAGDDERALAALAYPPGGPEESPPEEAKALPHQILAFYSRLRIRRLADDEIRRQLAAAFGDTRWGSSLPALLAGRWSDFYLNRDGAASAPFAHLPIPRCTDLVRCPDCPCREFCFAAEWIQLRANMGERARVTDQARFAVELHEMLKSP